MFKFLKEGLKKVARVFSERVEQEAQEEEALPETTEQPAIAGQPAAKAGERGQAEATEVQDIMPSEKAPSEKKAGLQQAEEKQARQEPPVPQEPVVEGKAERKGFLGMLQPRFFPPWEEKAEKAPEEQGAAERGAAAHAIERKKAGAMEAEAAVQEAPQAPASLPTPEEGLSAPADRPKAAEPKRSRLAAIAEKVTKKTVSEKKFEELFAELEAALLTNNIALEVTDAIRQELKKELVGKPLPRLGIEQAVYSALRSSIQRAVDVRKPDMLKIAREKRASGKPFVVLFAGINGSGKTTTIAKVAYLFKQKGMSAVIAAADTFRAASIQQLEKHAELLGIKVIKHDYGADPAAVAFDAVKYAEARKVDAVLIDTAGRLHSNINLMDEMKKIARVAKPDLKVFVGESITGNDCVEQARRFNEAIGIDAIILAKADVDEKGGTAVSVSYVTGKPILFLGTGQNYGDLEDFNPRKLVAEIGI